MQLNNHSLCSCIKKNRSLKKCAIFSKHVIYNKQYHITKASISSLLFVVGNLIDIQVPYTDNIDNYSKTIVNIILLATKNYEFLGIEILDMIMIIIIIGYLEKKKQMKD